MTEINARLEVLCAQRNQALDQAAVYAGKLFKTALKELTSGR